MGLSEQTHTMQLFGHRRGTPHTGAYVNAPGTLWGVCMYLYMCACEALYVP